MILMDGASRQRILLAALNTAMKLRDATEVEARLVALEVARRDGQRRDGQTTSNKRGRSRR